MEVIFKSEDIFSSVNASEASPYLGENVYVGDSLEALKQNVVHGDPCKLDDILGESAIHRFVDIDGNSHQLCIPAEKVIKHITKYRAFETIYEFELTLDIKHGDVLKVRGKDFDEDEGMELMYIGNSRRDGRNMVSLGNMCMRLAVWFDDYEYYDDTTEQWMPFGVAEE